MTGFLLFVLIVVVVVLVVAAQKKAKSDRRTHTRGRSSATRGDTAADRGTAYRDIGFPTAEPAPPKWLGRGEALQVKGFEIPSPITYVSSGRGTAQDPSEINRSLRVVEATDAEDLPYWPWYSRLTPEQRYIYLTWMASGRDRLPPNDGYLFIYYYGLERRALADDADHKLVFSEVQRLRSVYAKHGGERRGNSFMNYSSAFLWFLAAWKAELVKPQRVEALARRTRVWTEDKLAAALAWLAQRSDPLPAWMAYVVAEESPHSQRSVVTKRVSDEFRALFSKRYEEQFGTGLTLKTAKRERKIAYQPATSVISEATITVPNALGISSQFKKLAAIWNECIQDLRKLSSVARREGGEELTVAAWEAMPPELRTGVDHPLTDAFCDTVSRNTDEDGRVLVRVGELAEAMGLEKRAKLTPGQSREVRTTAVHIGFAIEPDERLTRQAYKWDELVAVFPRAYKGEPDYVRYGAAACMLRLGLAVAEADGRIDAEELSSVTEHIEGGFDLNEHERRRLEALRTLLLQTGSNISGLGKRLQTVLDMKGRQSVGRLLVAVAAADDVITKGELKSLRRCYRALGLSPETLDATLQELAPTTDEAPVTVMPGRPRRPGEVIPKPRREEAAVKLNREAIARIMHETREVSVLLAGAMNVVTDEVGTAVAVAEPEPVGRPESVPTPRAIVPPPRAASDVASKPKGRYVAFYDELIQKSEWTRDEAEALARQHGHMFAGAIESINDWAFDAFDGQLIYDDGDVIEIDQDLLRGSQ